MLSSSSLPSPPLVGEPVVIWAATARDASLARDTLLPNWDGVPVSDLPGLQRSLGAGCGVLLLAEEACSRPVLEFLGGFLESQPAWSDLPILFLAVAPTPGTLPGNDGFERLVKWLPRGNVSLLERPLRRATLIAAVEFALKARARQYEVRDLLRDKEREVAARDEFLAMLGHELRNPLAAIRYAGELLDLVDEAGQTQAPREVIARQTRTLGRLVDDLLDVARVTRGKISLDAQPLDLNEVAAKTLSSLEQAHKGAGHTVAISPCASPLWIEGDAVRLEQVFSNLLFNAIKYTPSGGHIKVCLELDGEFAKASIEDDGIGIAPPLLPRVFELFSQSEQAIDRARGGLGIGLTLVRGLVELHGGQVSAHSEGQGRGSRFEVRLPLHAPAKLSDAARGTGKGSGSCSILVIEDNADARELLLLLLRREGHTVEGAPDGKSGLERLIEWRPDLALVDVGLPEMDGYEVARHARQALGGAVRLVAVTGYGQPEDTQHALEAGFDQHLTKPVAPDELRAAIAATNGSLRL